MESNKLQMDKSWQKITRKDNQGVKLNIDLTPSLQHTYIAL